MKKRFAALLYILFVFITINACNVRRVDNNYIEINKDTSWFSDFTVLEDKVVFLCFYEIYNSSDKTVSVRLVGDFTKEQEVQLIQENSLQAIAINIEDISKIDTDFLSNAIWEYENNGDAIKIEPGKNGFFILYVGTYAGNEQRPNRLLPDTKVYVCE